MFETPPTVLQKLIEIILATKTKKPLLVAVNGKDAAGKTILADNLAKHLKNHTSQPIVRISFDNFLNKDSIRNGRFESEARGSYENAFNYKGFIEYFLKPISSEDTTPKYANKIYDLSTDTEITPKFIRASSNTIFIVDGLFLYRSELVDYWGVRVLLNADDNILIERGSRRDADTSGGYENAKERYLKRYIPSQEIYYAEANPEKVAHIIINNSDPKRAFVI